MIVFSMISYLFATAFLGISVAPLQQEVGPYETFHENYSVVVPSDIEKHDPSFLQALKEKSIFLPFLVKNVRVEGTDNKRERSLTYEFSLLSRGPGSHFFSPGTLPFSGRVPLVFPATAVTVKGSLPWTVFQERLLPLNPDQALSLSQKNYGLSFQEIAEQEQSRSEKLYAKRESALAAISISALGLVTALLLFWVVCELELHKRLKPAVPKEVNWKAELHKVLQHDSLPFRVRLQLLSQIIPRVCKEEQKNIKAVLEELEEIRFSGVVLDREAQDKCWKKMSKSLSVLLSK